MSYISGPPGDDVQISRVPLVKNILSNKIQQELLSANIFECLSDHDLENIFETQDMHSTQLTKKVISCYL